MGDYYCLKSIILNYFVCVNSNAKIQCFMKVIFAVTPNVLMQCLQDLHTSAFEYSREYCVTEKETSFLQLDCCYFSQPSARNFLTDTIALHKTGKTAVCDIILEN